jgi:hypothetical protein
MRGSDPMEQSYCVRMYCHQDRPLHSVGRYVPGHLWKVGDLKAYGMSANLRSKMKVSRQEYV